MKYFLRLTILFVWTIIGESCTDHDRSYEDMTPPKVDIASTSVSGIVTDINGNALADAVVQIGDKKMKTNLEGYYCLKKVKPGEHPVIITQDGMADVKSTIIVEQPSTIQFIPFNVTMFPKDYSVTKAIKSAEGGQINFRTLAMKGNDLARILIQLDVPAHSLSNDEVISLQQLHTESDSLSHFYSENLLTGIMITCQGNPAKLSHPMKVSMTLDEELANMAVVKKISGNQWSNINNSVNQSVVCFEVNDFGSYGIFIPMTLSESVSQNSVIMKWELFDNMYGAGWLDVPQAYLSYVVGMDIRTKASSVLTALMKERLAAVYGNKSAEVTDSCRIDITLPVGTCLRIKGIQEYAKVSLSANEHTIEGTAYKTVFINGTTYDREGTGGSN